MNPKLGDVDFKVGAKNYVLNMGVNALCLIEEKAGAPATEIIERLMVTPRLSDVRMLLWAGLQRHHAGVSIDAAGDMVQALNRGDRKAFEIILESMRLCSPDAEEANGPADPPQSPATDAGTGTPSS